MTESQLREVQRHLVAVVTGVPERADDHGVDRRALNLLARLSAEKRMLKITRVLPKTVDYLGRDFRALAAAFQRSHPQTTADNYRNACWFYAWLTRLTRAGADVVPFAADVAFCELALVGLTRKAPPGPHAEQPFGPQNEVTIRCRPEVRLRRCRYNVRACFERGVSPARVPPREETCVAVSRPAGARSPQLTELDADLMAMLKGLRSWRSVPEADIEALSELLPRLIQRGLVEVRSCACA